MVEENIATKRVWEDASSEDTPQKLGPIPLHPLRKVLILLLKENNFSFLFFTVKIILKGFVCILQVKTTFGGDRRTKSYCIRFFTTTQFISSIIQYYSQKSQNTIVYASQYRNMDICNFFINIVPINVPMLLLLPDSRNQILLINYLENKLEKY